MENEQIKQVIEGFTYAMRGLWNNPNLTVPKDIAEKYNIDEKFCEKAEICKMRDVMDIKGKHNASEQKTCERCKHEGKFENEVEYGYPSPCIQCKRRVSDNYNE